MTPKDLKKTCDKNIITKKTLMSKYKITNSVELFETKISIQEDTNLIIGKNSFIESCNIYSSGRKNTIIIGDNCKLKGTNIMCCGDNNKIIIGDEVTINGEFWGNTTLHTMESTKINIGNDCMISGNVVIRTTDGHSIINSKGKRINIPNNINIKKHVWIGMNSIILKGVTIASGSIVGANSVVTHSFNNHSIIAGNAAKEINKNNDFDWNRKQGSNFSSRDFNIF